MSDNHDKAAPSQEKGTERTQASEKPKTEQASHQGGGGARSDHKPQGPGTK
jgi:hypothetical protein